MPEQEEDIEGIFAQVMEVRDDSPEAQKLADQYLFENLVRIHREGEGAPYTGVKPEGTPMEEAIVSADRSIATGTLSPLEELVEPELIRNWRKPLRTFSLLRILIQAMSTQVGGKCESRRGTY